MTAALHSPLISERRWNKKEDLLKSESEAPDQCLHLSSYNGNVLHGGEILKPKATEYVPRIPSCEGLFPTAHSCEFTGSRMKLL
jgi:hypothetical protein